MTKDVLKDIDKRIDNLQKARDLIEPVVDVPGDIVVSVCDGNRIRIKTQSTEQLHEVRSYLRDKLGSWSDDVTHVFTSMGRGIAIYNNDTPYELWLEFDINNTPKGLIKSGCRFVQRERVDYDLVCDPE